MNAAVSGILPDCSASELFGGQNAVGHPSLAGMRRQRRCEAAEPGAKKRALVVHDSPLMRFGLISLVELHPLVSVCAEASHGPAACERCAQEEPGLIVLDLASARCDGLVLLRELRRIEPRAAVVVVIGCEPGDAMLAGRARRAGACACVSCRDEAAVLLAAVEAALRGRLFASKRLAALLLAEAPRDTRRQAGGDF